MIEAIRTGTARCTDDQKPLVCADYVVANLLEPIRELEHFRRAWLRGSESKRDTIGEDGDFLSLDTLKMPTNWDLVAFPMVPPGYVGQMAVLAYPR